MSKSNNVQASLAAAAIRNPMFQLAAKKAFFESVPDEESGTKQDGLNSDGAFTIDDIDAEEFERIKYWARILKVAMIGISTLMIVCAWYNIASASNSVATNFLALYVFFLSVLLCCYEIALRQAALYIVQNFGFMYNPLGRAFFLVFIAILCFQLSTFGIVMFCFLLIFGMVEIYVRVVHPKYGKYIRSLHYYENVAPGAQATPPATTTSA